MPTRIAACVCGARRPELRRRWRMTASWSGSTDPTAYKSVARKMCPNGELPSDSQQTDRHQPDAEVREKPVSQFIIAPRAQASRRCETQAR